MSSASELGSGGRSPRYLANKTACTHWNQLFKTHPSTQASNQYLVMSDSLSKERPEIGPVWVESASSLPVGVKTRTLFLSDAQGWIERVSPLPVVAKTFEKVGPLAP